KRSFLPYVCFGSSDWSKISHGNIVMSTGLKKVATDSERLFRPSGAKIVSNENPGLAPGATLCRRSAAVHCRGGDKLLPITQGEQCDEIEETKPPRVSR